MHGTSAICFLSIGLTLDCPLCRHVCHKVPEGISMAILQWNVLVPVFTFVMQGWMVSAKDSHDFTRA